MDALSHCLEAYCAPGFHPMADGIAAEGLRLIHRWLKRAYEEGGDLEARGHMLVAASMGATAFQKGLGGCTLCRTRSALVGSHHGLTNAVLMPYVLRFNRAAIEPRISALAAYLGSNRRASTDFDWIVALRRDLGIPPAWRRSASGRIRSSGSPRWPRRIHRRAAIPCPSAPPKHAMCSRRRCGEKPERVAKRERGEDRRTLPYDRVRLLCDPSLTLSRPRERAFRP